ncbi:MAG: recombinase family protein [Parcubacteria group bacterium]|nr:recombinase family protein [Parcubacteria group bacterium]
MTKPNKDSSFGKTTTPDYEDRQGIVYARVSSKRQETEGSGLQSQEARCVSDLHAIGVPHNMTFSDSYTGGGDFMNRPAMRGLLAYIDAKPHKKFVVIFDDLKRFARDVEFHQGLRKAFRARDVVLRCLNYSFDDTPEGRFAEIIMAGQAELEREQNRRQVIQKQKARLEAGYWSFGSKKGYVMVKKAAHGKLAVPSDTEAQPLKEALEGFSKGTFVRRIDACKYLVEKGFWKNQKPEKYIDNFTKILKESFYAGYIEYPKWEVERRIGKHEGIISLETFEINQKRLKKEAHNKRVRMDISNDFPLRNLVACDHCGEHLTAAWSKGREKRYPYYICHNKACEYYGKSIRKADIEGKFEEVLKKQKLKPQIKVLVTTVFDRVWKDTVSNLQNKEALLLKDKNKLEGKAQKLTDMIIASKSENIKKVYERQIEETANEIEEIKNESIRDVDLSIPYRTALDKATGLLENPHKYWQKLEVGEKQKLFYFIFEQKLPYNQNEGYRTAGITSYTRLFEDFATQNPLNLEMAGVEPASRKTN